MKSVTCIICREPCGAREVNEHFPFCSRRCQLVDLGRWLDGDYRIPSEDIADIEAPRDNGEEH